MIGPVLKKTLAWLGITRDLAWFDRRIQLEKQEIIAIPIGAKLKVSEQFYQIEAPIGDVYSAYIRAKPADLWPKKWIVFHFLLLPNSTERKNAAQYPCPLPIGSRVFVELLCRPLHRWLRLMVGVQVTELSHNHSLRYDYLEGSVTMGYNRIQFTEFIRENGTVYTQIHHYSEYLGTSALLRIIMPFFQKSLHVGFVDALHSGMKNTIELQSDTCC